MYVASAVVANSNCQGRTIASQEHRVGNTCNDLRVAQLIFQRKKFAPGRRQEAQLEARHHEGGDECCGRNMANISARKPRREGRLGN